MRLTAYLAVSHLAYFPVSVAGTQRLLAERRKEIYIWDGGGHVALRDGSAALQLHKINTGISDIETSIAFQMLMGIPNAPPQLNAHDVAASNDMNNLNNNDTGLVQLDIFIRLCKPLTGEKKSMAVDSKTCTSHGYY